MQFQLRATNVTYISTFISHSCIFSRFLRFVTSCAKFRLLETLPGSTISFRTFFEYKLRGIREQSGQHYPVTRQFNQRLCFDL